MLQIESRSKNKNLRAVNTFQLLRIIKKMIKKTKLLKSIIQQTRK